MNTIVHRRHGFFDGLVDTRVAHHVAVGKIDDDPVVLASADGFHELVLHLVCAHFRLEVIGGHLRTRYEDAVFALEGSLASAVEEEGDVGIFLRLCGVELAQALRCEVFAEGVRHVLLREEHVYALEAGIVGRHAEELYAGDGGHASVGHILL